MKGSIVSRIDEIESLILNNETRLDEIERSLRVSDIDADKRKTLKTEESGLKILLSEQKQELGLLRKENRKSMLVSVIILASISALYALYSVQ